MSKKDETKLQKRGTDAGGDETDVERAEREQREQQQQHSDDAGDTLTDEQREEQRKIDERRAEQDKAKDATDKVREDNKGGIDGAAKPLNATDGDPAVQAEIDRRRDEQARARGNALGMTAGFTDDMTELLEATSTMLREGARSISGADIGRVLRAALAQAGMLQSDGLLAPPDQALINRAAIQGGDAGAAQGLTAPAYVDTRTQSEIDGDLVHVNVPKSFRLRLDNGVVRTFKAGAQRMPRDISEHHYARANGVTVVE